MSVAIDERYSIPGQRERPKVGKHSDDKRPAHLHVSFFLLLDEILTIIIAIVSNCVVD